MGVHPPKVDIDTIVAGACGPGSAEHSFAVDANMALSGRRRGLSAARGCALLENIEEPVASLRLMEQLASDFDAHTSAHCTDLDAMMPYRHVDCVPTLDACGGITGVRLLAQALGEAGRRVWVRSHAESGIGWAAIVHLGMSTPELGRPAQSLMDLCTEDLILGDRWDVREGGVCARRPSQGRGVSLDRAALDTCHELYCELGEVQAFPPALRRAPDRVVASEQARLPRCRKRIG